MKTLPDQLYVQWENALQEILRWWQVHAPDESRGGFAGRIDNDNCVDADAPKGAVLHARILWTFAAAARRFGDASFFETAALAWNYLHDHFIDREQGGVFWSLRASGEVLDTKKQVYAQAFAIYAFAEYHLATGNAAALKEAIDLFNLLEAHSYDSTQGGYLEAQDRYWQPLPDLRLSEKDANEPKSMNTHLHVLEAYANLFRAWPKPHLRERITELLELFSRKIINRSNGHLHLFFGMDWKVQGQTISYGHDIEAAWLLLEAAEVLGDQVWIDTMQRNCLQMAQAAAEGLDADGGLWHEYDPARGHLLREKHWWPQAEAMVGFYAAWEQDQQAHWLEKLQASWAFIETYLLDRRHGEWYWGVDGQHRVLAGEDKAGFWKCPYHNGRALLELLKRKKYP